MNPLKSIYNAVVKEYQLAFWVACEHSNIATIEKFIQQHPNAVRWRKKSGMDGGTWTPLHFAAYYGQAAACEALIKGGADVNARSSNAEATPLIVSAYLIHDGLNAEAAKVLIRAEANLDAKDKHGNTALLFSVKEFSDTTLVRLLLDHECSIDNLYTVFSDTPQQNILEIAEGCYLGRRESRHAGEVVERSKEILEMIQKEPARRQALAEEIRRNDPRRFHEGIHQPLRTGHRLALKPRQHTKP